MQRRSNVGVSGDEIVTLLGSVCPFGIWRAEISTGLVFWSEDAYRVHGMEYSEEPVSLKKALSRYHPEDAVIVEQLMETATTQRNGYRYVMRVQDGMGGYRLVASAGCYRPDNGGELIGYFHEYQELVRSVILTEE